MIVRCENCAPEIAYIGTEHEILGEQIQEAARALDNLARAF